MATDSPSTDAGSYSLVRRLVAAVLVAACLVAAAAGLAIRSAVLEASAREFDERLVHEALVILLYADHEYAESDALSTVGPDFTHPPAKTVVIYQIWSLNGESVYRSADAPATPLVPLDAPGFRDVTLASGAYRAYALRSSVNPLVVEIADPLAMRQQIAQRALQVVMAPLLLALPALALLCYLLARRALRPIRSFADAIDARAPTDRAPVDTARMPDETRALGRALNTLLARQGEALAREARFTGDAAHELRTPLAAVRTQAQVALRARSPDELHSALTQLTAGVDRSHRLVMQLLSLSRVEDGAVLASTPRPLASVIESVLQDLAELAARSQARIDVGEVPAVEVPEEPWYLLLRNLIDNALRHAPVDGVVGLRVAVADARLTVTVVDHGPGMPPELRARVGERFFRHSPAYEGSGLGLAIVARVVEHYRGQLRFAETDPGGGLTVQVDLPLP